MLEEVDANEYGLRSGSNIESSLKRKSVTIKEEPIIAKV